MFVFGVCLLSFVAICMIYNRIEEFFADLRWRKNEKRRASEFEAKYNT